MKPSWMIPALATGVPALFLGLVLGRMFRGSEPEPAGSPVISAADEHDHGASGSAPGEATIWTCSMHPQIQQSQPGKCPICGMDLVPVERGMGGDAGPRTLVMSDSARALAEITTTPVVRGYPEVEVRLVGKLDYDETRVKSLAARFPARIERLFVNYTGIRVEPGDHLAVIYSPELLSAQRELLTAVQFDPQGATARLAREKLRLWDLQPDQIDAIVERGVAQDNFELRAPIGGVVVQKNVKEGDYVNTGDPLFRIADLGSLWLSLEAYESDLPWLRYGQPVHFTIESLPGESFEGQIVFIDPVLDTVTRTVDVRVEVTNTDGRLKPGMLARAVVYSRIAAGGRVIAPELAGKWISPMHPEIIKDGPGKCDVCGMDLVPVESLGYTTAPDEAPLLVPATAVLRTGKRAVVYVEVPDREMPTYEGREITLGPRAGGVFIVAGGLREGELVVTNGAFKIDSALQIQAKPSMMNPEGARGGPAHDHGVDGAPERRSAPAEPPASGPDHAGRAGHAGVESAAAVSPESAAQWLDLYFDLQAALAGDDPGGARTAAERMRETARGVPELSAALQAIAAAESLDAMRRPHFEVVSRAMVAALRSSDPDPGRTVYLKHCPMVYPDRGADWLQPEEPTSNPYFGAAMLRCGETRETLGR